MRKRERRSVEIFSLSFLDVVSCGFGAIVLLLVIVKISEPAVIEKLSVDLSGRVKELSTELPVVRNDTALAARQLEQKRAELAAGNQTLARLSGELSTVQGQYKTTKNEHAAQTIIDELSPYRNPTSEYFTKL